MSSKYGFLSFLALGLLLVLIFKNYEIWTRPVALVPEKDVGKKSQTGPQSRAEIPSTSGVQKDPASVKSYISIAAKNIFSPERKDFPIPVGDGKKELVRPQVILYGVTITGDYRAASVSNPGRPLQKGEREIFTVRAGERIGDYKLSKILSDRITLEAQGDSFEVLLYGGKVPKRRTDVKTESKPATVTSTQPSAGSPGAVFPVSPPGVPGTPIPTAPVVQGTPTPTPAPVIPSVPLPSRRGRMPYYPTPSPGSGNPVVPGVPPASPQPEIGGN